MWQHVWQHECVRARARARPASVIVDTRPAALTLRELPIHEPPFPLPNLPPALLSAPACLAP
eukprot:3133252-Pleurochrysis_carterae.AAC.3